MIIKSPMNYPGNKCKILPQIKHFFPKDVDTMIDVFCGGGDVTFNTHAKRHIANDVNVHVIDIYKTFQRTGISESIEYIDSTIDEWKLSKTNEEAFLSFRDHYNETKNPLDLYVLMCYSFNYQIRFNSDHEYNSSFGRNRSSFNLSMRQNLRSLRSVIYDVEFESRDFRELDYDVSCNDFVYCDPPYLISDAVYNNNPGFDSWDESSERDLYDLLDELDKRLVRFAVSNVTHHKGQTNDILIDWVERNDYYLHEIKKNYNNCNYQDDNKSNKTKEVLITNYSTYNNSVRKSLLF